MAPQPRWRDPDGLATINVIVKKLIPTWTNGLHPVQLELISAILDGQDVLCCTATGDGKSAAFSIPTLVLLEYNRTPGTYIIGLPSRNKPIGIVITPTKGLADNIVLKLSKLNVSAFSYCKQTLTVARKTGIHLATEIKDCTKWQVICVDPEHLHDNEWREVTGSPIFQANILFACVNEAHLINEWGVSFRPAFSIIGTFLHGRFPPSMSVVGLTATLEPRAPTASVCKSLGFFDGRFTFIRRSNERPNTQFSIQFLPRGLSGDKFDFLLPYLADLRKTIIHCRTIDQVSHVHAYLWRLQPEGTDKLRRARIYHKMDPQLQIIICTVTFSNGLNAKSLLDSLSLGFGSTFNETWQEKGHVGCDPETVGRGIVFAPHRIIKEANSYLASLTSPAALQGQRKDQSKKKKKKSTPAVFDKSKALMPLILMLPLWIVSLLAIAYHACSVNNGRAVTQLFSLCPRCLLVALDFPS
ncbi:P-loop containing nucleoside triphosphate hydrolase protein [Gymnopilus junonius]|uniref:P-loop containing nucleoside triphosphate hydrolase protein n=1 Tax=Gymnopilus junonius TaxID=109634 RepID=A0A9P5NF37_GYMJU|nr:P-loop containing nucleoside triphosphate hydrolase protein [Gymnopilus junonius]